MDSSAFDYHLPPALIAQQRCFPPEAARMLYLGEQTVGHRRITDLLASLTTNDLVVVNTTRVLPARLITEDNIAIQLLEPAPEAADISIENQFRRSSEDCGSSHRWRALAKPMRRLRQRSFVKFRSPNRQQSAPLGAAVVGFDDKGAVILAFELPGDLSFANALDQHGWTPLPPYLQPRADPTQERVDRQLYQSVFAKIPGAVAAPTASLHFSPSAVTRLSDRGVAFAPVVLHISGATFLPLKTSRVADHPIQKEWVAVEASTIKAINQAKQNNARVVIVGTTVLRALVTACQRNDSTELAPFTGYTDLFLRPLEQGDPIPNPLPCADALLTNFHAPQSPLLALVAALIGYDKMRSVYDLATKQSYRFLSYGDAMLIDFSGRFHRDLV